MKRNLNKLTPNIEWTGEYSSKVRGEEYFEADKIKIQKSSDQFIYAKSKGDDLYTTTLEWSLSALDDLELIVSCSCPSYKKTHAPCKHIWGVLRKSEDIKEPQSAFIKTISKYSIIDDIYLATHMESDDYGHLSATSYQNGLMLELSEQDSELEPPEPWKKDLETLQKYIEDANDDNNSNHHSKKTSKSNIWYELEAYTGIQLYSNYDCINVNFYEASLLRDGRYGKIKKRSFNQSNLTNSKYQRDSKYLNLLKGHLVFDYSKYANEAAIPSSLGKLTLKELVSSQRLFTYSHDNVTGSDIIPLGMKENTFSFSANIRKDESNWVLGGLFKLNNIEVEAQDATLTTDLAFIVYDYNIYPTDLGKLRTHCEYLIGYGNIVIPLEQKEELKKVIKNTIGLEQTLIDGAFGLEKKVLQGIPKIEFVINERKDNNILAELKFLYDKELHTPLSKKDLFNDSSVNDLFFIKDQAFEKKILNFLSSSSEVHQIEHIDHYTFELDFAGLNKFIKEAGSFGIEIRTQGYKVKHHNTPQARIKSENDWFELEGHIHFDKDAGISIPEIIKKKTIDNNFILLGDGTLGVKPSSWLKKMNKLAELGIKEENRFKFNRAQSIILDLLLDEGEYERDEQFRKTVQSLRSFRGVENVKISKKFKGELRDYQKSGVNWLNFLHQFKIGGCLADDMGLGKTIQVLAHLQKLKNSKDKNSHGQHLIVVPKSLVYNWQSEAQKFAPDLKVLVYEGTKRDSLFSDFPKYDLIIMTYAVMRMDISVLKEYEFSYSVLDEAQYIKNTTTLVAKAAYLINSKHKLALTGTPIENHVGELFSIFRYLIPNILPKGYSLGKIRSSKGSMKVILKGLMPFILRRTKSEVLTELPEKIESVLYCNFERKQEKIYNDMKSFYQKSLTQKVDDANIKKSKIQILEALLRMRQASCHPGLINKEYQDLSSSKIITLMENLDSLISRGEKVLVFSQFTSFLKIIETELKNNDIGYAYLDGQTNKRESIVNSFKKDPKKNVFLISLKAGGVGLNLTEANYCFLVDPWWNPAVESQAIDRIHRIGQSKKVFAYRLITKGSIEEKILKLQNDKRNVSDNILATDDSLLKQMSAEDLNFLFK